MLSLSRDSSFSYAQSGGTLGLCSSRPGHRFKPTTQHVRFGARSISAERMHNHALQYTDILVKEWGLIILAVLHDLLAGTFMVTSRLVDSYLGTFHPTHMHPF